ncbi:MAG: hypothetical protein GVY26_17550 [Bacteroidetes bacterium]|nr:hypothetical protein [Bacteroidota bacterium]
MLPMLVILLLSSCTAPLTEEATSTIDHPVQAIVLGVAQDAGYPQANCQKACCQPAWGDTADTNYTKGRHDRLCIRVHANARIRAHRVPASFASSVGNSCNSWL